MWDTALRIALGVLVLGAGGVWWMSVMFAGAMSMQPYGATAFYAYGGLAVGALLAIGFWFW